MATKAFDHQVAGHVTSHGKPCFLLDNDGHVLKLFDGEKLHNNEINFYSTIYAVDQSNKDLLTLRKYVPAYFGVYVEKQQGQPLTYLMLENLITGFQKPCILDIKIGKITWGPFASEEKIRRESSKCVVQNTLGFRITGYKVYNANSGSYVVKRRHQLGPLKPEDVPRALAEAFLLKEHASRRRLIRDCIAKLKGIVHWYEQQTVVKLTGTSILIVYEGSEYETPSLSRNNGLHPRTDCSHSTQAGLENESNNNARLYVNGTSKDPDSENKGSSGMKVHIIDFCYTYISEGNTDIDENYTFGMKNLIANFETLVSRDGICNGGDHEDRPDILNGVASNS